MLAEFLESLDDDGKEMANILQTTPIPDYRRLLREFTNKKKYFQKLDDILVDLGYRGLHDDIKNMHDIIRQNIKELFIMEYNNIFRAKIWNHFDILYEDPKNNKDYYFLLSNPAAFPILNFTSEDYSDNVIYKYPLSRNVAAIDLLTRQQDLIDWDGLSENPAAIDLLKANLDKVEWYWFSGNPAAIDILKENPDKIDWDRFSKVCSDEEYLWKNIDKIVWHKLARNPHATNVLRWFLNSLIPESKETFNVKNLNILNHDYILFWSNISENPAAIDILKENPDKMNWVHLCLNTSPDAIKMLEANQDKIHWNCLSLNPAAIHLLKNNRDKLSISCLNSNPYDYLREKIDHFNSLKLFPKSRLIIKTVPEE